MPYPQTPFPKHAGRFTARTKWGRAFFNAQREGSVSFSSRSCRRASRSFTPGVALSEPLLGVLSKHESGGVRRPCFLLQSKGEGRALRPCCEKKWWAIFQKSTTFVRNTWSFAKNSPVFWGLSTARGRKEPAGLPHSARVKIAAGGLLGFPPPTKSTTPIKAPHEDYFF